MAPLVKPWATPVPTRIARRAGRRAQRINCLAGHPVFTLRYPEALPRNASVSRGLRAGQRRRHGFNGRDVVGKTKLHLNITARAPSAGSRSKSNACCDLRGGAGGSHKSPREVGSGLLACQFRLRFMSVFNAARLYYVRSSDCPHRSRWSVCWCNRMTLTQQPVIDLLVAYDWKRASVMHNP